MPTEFKVGDKVAEAGSPNKLLGEVRFIDSDNPKSGMVIRTMSGSVYLRNTDGSHPSVSSMSAVKYTEKKVEERWIVPYVNLNYPGSIRHQAFMSEQHALDWIKSGGPQGGGPKYRFGKPQKVTLEYAV